MLTAKSLSQAQVLSAFAHLCKADVRPDERHVSVARLDPYDDGPTFGRHIYRPHQPSIVLAPFSCQPVNRSTLSIFYGLWQAGRYGLLFPLPYRLHEVP